MGELRIIAGSLRRRRIAVPPGLSVRPTSDRVREALFDILGPTLEGASVLDAFAGSGALGLEALSRGARSAVFVESEADALVCLRANVQRLGVEERCHVLARRVEHALRDRLPQAPFDLVLADPPYAAAEAGPFLRALVQNALLAGGARVVLERSQDSPPVGLGDGSLLPLVRSARYGSTRLDFYRETRDSAGSPGQA